MELQKFDCRYSRVHLVLGQGSALIEQLILKIEFKARVSYSVLEAMKI